MPHSVMHPNSIGMAMLKIFEKRDDRDEFETETECIVKLNMGPYEANGIIRHRIQRIKGLQDLLSKSGYNVELAHTSHIDRFTMDFYDREIFRCNIKNFEFNLPAEEDPLCMKAMQTLQEHEERFFRDRNIPKFVHVHHGMRFLEENKLYTTEDCLSGSNIQLLFEISDRNTAKELQIITEKPVSLKEDSDDLDIDYSFIPVTHSTDEIEEIKERAHATVKISVDEGNLFQERQKLRSSMANHESPDYVEVLDKAAKSVRMRRASYMFKSGEIRSMQFDARLSSSIYFDLNKPEVKNQKIIAKVLNYRKELRKLVKN